MALASTRQETDLPEMLTRSDLEAYLRLGKSAVIRLTCHPEFPALKVGGSIRIPREAFLAWLQRQQVHPQGLTLEPCPAPTP